MTLPLRCLLACFVLGLAGPVQADREVHVIAVENGFQPDDYLAWPEVHVLVERPGQAVSLVLLDGGEVHWRVEASSGTIISEIVRSGPNAEDSKVSLFGIPMGGVQIPGLPRPFQPVGRDFRTLVDSLTERFETGRIHSFQGMYQADAKPVKVDHVDTTTAGLARNYLSQQLGESDDLPEEIRNWIESGGANDGLAVIFDSGGVSLTGPTGTRRFPATSDIPDILLPTASVYDPGSQMIYGITFGGEGYLYSVDVQTGEWAVVANMDEYDAAGLLYDPENRQLITTGAFSRPGDIRVFGLDGRRSGTFVPTTAFPGLTDLFNYGNEHGPPLKPRAFSEGWVILEAPGRPDSAYPDTGQYRIYALRIATGEVRLLRYRNE